MSATPPLARLVEEVASQAALVTDLLPGGWHHLYVPGVDRPVVLGPGGVFVLDVRHQATLPIGVQNDRPWANDHRNQMSTPRLTAELSSQLLSWACGIEINVTPVIVLAGVTSVVLSDRRNLGSGMLRQRLGLWAWWSPCVWAPASTRKL